MLQKSVYDVSYCVIIFYTYCMLVVTIIHVNACYILTYFILNGVLFFVTLKIV